MNHPQPGNSIESLMIEDRASVLLRITSAIETAATLDELLMLALNACAELLGVPLGGVALLSDDGQQAQLVNVYPPRTTLPPAVPLSAAPYLQQVIKSRQLLQINDVREMAPTTILRQMLFDADVSSLLVVPLIAQDQPIGALAFAAIREQREFGGADMALARLMAGQLAAAITSFRITEAAQRRSAELATLNDIAEAVTSSLDTQEVYHLVVQKLNEYFRVDAGSLLMRDEESGDLHFVMTLEAGEEKLAGVRVPRGQGIVGDVAETRQPAIVLDAQNDPRFYRKISDDVGYTTQSILCVPMVVKSRTIGVIELLNKRDGPFTQDDAVRLMRMAATIGVAIENARLFQQVTTGRDRFEAILNSTNDGILMADMRGLIATANPMAAQILQIEREALLGQSLEAVLEALQARAIDVTMPSWLTAELGTVAALELELGGVQRCFVRHLMLPVHDADGAEIGRLALLQDISKERELAQLREDYTGMMVHDLRAPLTAIMNGIMMVRRGVGGPVTAQQEELLDIAHQSSQTMLAMVNTLLDIAKMEQGSMALDLERVSPYDLVDATLDRLRASAKQQQVQLEQQLATDLPSLEVDRETIIRVLQNLLDNAIKFSPAGKVTTLGVAHFDAAAPAPALPLRLPELASVGWLVFWIQDRGPGIPAQYHDRIFEKFGQVRGGKVRGTGLGLTFCKLAVESHRGKIWLESVQGKGSTFAFALPLERQEAGLSGARAE